MKHCLFVEADVVRLLLLLLLSVASVVSVSVGNSRHCPAVCVCHFNATTGDRVLCSSGGVRQLGFLSRLAVSTAELVVDAPDWQPNTLIIGPLFRRFSAFLRLLAVRRSQVPAIGDNTFFGLRVLHTLDLSWNRLTHLAAANFHGLSSLQYLHLHHNNIESAPSACFRRLERLRLLDLSHNRLTQLTSRQLMGLDQLEQLIISHNQLHQLSVSVMADVPRLRELHCVGCQLRQVNQQLQRALPLLEVLDLGHNMITHLRHSDLSQFTSLRELSLAGNHMTSLSANCFRHLHLISLDISQNNLTDILDNSIFVGSTIENLDLSYNGLQNVTSSLLAPVSESLRNLSLAGSHMTTSTLQKLLLAVPTISHLSLADCNLLALPDGLFDSVSRLQTLNLSGNLLLDVSVRLLQPLNHLISADLSNNQLSSLGSTLVVRFNRLQTVQLTENPWDCSRCKVEPMLLWVTQSVVFRDACSQHRWDRCLRCASPESLAQQELSSLQLDQLPLCQNDNHQTTARYHISTLEEAEYGGTDYLSAESSDSRRHSQVPADCRPLTAGNRSEAGLTLPARAVAECSTPTQPTARAVDRGSAAPLQLWRASITLLIALASCVLLLLLLLTAVAAALLCRRRAAAAVYYTGELCHSGHGDERTPLGELNLNTKKVHIVSGDCGCRQQRASV